MKIANLNCGFVAQMSFCSLKVFFFFSVFFLLEYLELLCFYFPSIGKIFLFGGWEGVQIKLFLGSNRFQIANYLQKSWEFNP